MIIAVVTILALGGGALLFLRSGDSSQNVDSLSLQTEQTFEQTVVEVPQPEQFVDEQGNHWMRQPDGSMLWWNGTEWQQVS